MTREEDLVRSTTRAIASTVRGVAPLRLEPAPDELRHSRRPEVGAGNRRLRPSHASTGPQMAAASPRKALPPTEQNPALPRHGYCKVHSAKSTKCIVECLQVV